MRPFFLDAIHQVYMKRGLQIAITFTLTIFIQEWFRYPNAPYTGFVVMMIYIGFDVGTVRLRGLQRFLGTLLGCLAGFLYWYLGHLNYRSIWVLIIFWIFNYIYFSNYTYRTSTFFTMSLTLIGAGYLDNQGTLPATEIVTDIFISTVIGYLIIVVCEEFIFGKNKLCFQIFHHLQSKFIEDIRQCENDLSQTGHTSLTWNDSYEKVLEDLNYIKIYILMNETLLLQVIPKNELEEFIRLAEDYYLGLSLKVCLLRRNDLNKTQDELPYLQLMDLIERHAHEL